MVSPTPVTARPTTEERVSVGRKLAYGGGGFADVFIKQIINNIANPVFQIALGVSPTLIGLAIGIVRLWDAFADLVVGKVSDRSQSRFGRRRLFIAVGTVWAAAGFIALMWFPRGVDTTYYFWHFFIGSLVFFTGYTIYSVPFAALGYEMTKSYNERTRVFAYSSFFGGIASLAVSWAFAFTQLPLFGDTIGGSRALGVVGALLMIGAGLLPCLFLREGGTAEEQRVRARETKPLSWAEGRSALKLRPYRIVLMLVFLMLLSAWMVQGLGVYLNVYFVYPGNMAQASVIQGWAMTGQQITTILGVPVISWLATRLGKRRTLQLCLGCMLLGSLSKFYTFHPSRPYLEIVTMALLGPGTTAVFMLCQSFLADICDLDELENGQRREGFLGAVYLWATKLAISFGFISTGIVLAATGFDQSVGMNQPAGTILGMRLLFALVPAGAIILAMFLVTRLKLEKEDVAAIQAALRERAEARART